MEVEAGFQVRELRGLHTIVLSTHILPEVERTADHVLIIAGGRIVAQGSPDELRRDVSRGLATLCMSGGMGMALALER